MKEGNYRLEIIVPKDTSIVVRYLNSKGIFPKVYGPKILLTLNIKSDAMLIEKDVKAHFMGGEIKIMLRVIKINEGLGKHKSKLMLKHRRKFR